MNPRDFGRGAREIDDHTPAAWVQCRTAIHDPHLRIAAVSKIGDANRAGRMDTSDVQPLWHLSRSAYHSRSRGHRNGVRNTWRIQPALRSLLRPPAHQPAGRSGLAVAALTGRERILRLSQWVPRRRNDSATAFFFPMTICHEGALPPGIRLHPCSTSVDEPPQGARERRDSVKRLSQRVRIPSRCCASRSGGRRISAPRPIPQSNIRPLIIIIV
jgi:hypothetical protein